MINSSYPALSAIRAFEKKQAVTANNVANINTDSFKKSRAVCMETTPCGVTVSVSQIDSPGTVLPAYDGSGQGRETSNVVVEEEINNLVATSRGFSANIQSLKAEDEMIEKLINVLA